MVRSATEWLNERKLTFKAGDSAASLAKTVLSLLLLLAEAEILGQVLRCISSTVGLILDGVGCVSDIGNVGSRIGGSHLDCRSGCCLVAGMSRPRAVGLFGKYQFESNWPEDGECAAASTSVWLAVMHKFPGCSRKNNGICFVAEAKRRTANGNSWFGWKQTELDSVFLPVLPAHYLPRYLQVCNRDKNLLLT